MMRIEFRKFKTRVLALIAITAVCPTALLPQTADKKDKKGAEANPASLSLAVDAARKTSDLPPAPDTAMNEGQNWGGFEVKQSAEFGGRISDFTGSAAMWGTFVNLGSGTRLLEYTLDMRSPSHTGKLFDDFSFSSFGSGGGAPPS